MTTAMTEAAVGRDDSRSCIREYQQQGFRRTKGDEAMLLGDLGILWQLYNNFVTALYPVTIKHIIPAITQMHLSSHIPTSPRSEWVVLRRDLVDEEVANERNLLENVLLHARHAVEEEKGEDAGRGAESTGHHGAVVKCQHLRV